MKFYRLSDATFMIELIRYQFIKRFLDKKMCLLVRNMELLKARLSN